MDQLLSGRVYTMLHQQAVLDPEEAYSIAELLADVSGGVWREIATPGEPIVPLRRALQRRFLARIGAQLERQRRPIDTARLEKRGVPREAAEILLSRGEGTDFAAAAKAILSELARDVQLARHFSTDPASRAHLAESELTLRRLTLSF